MKNRRRRSVSKGLKTSFARSIDEHSEQARQVFADLLPKIEKELKLLTPKSPCCNASTYMNAEGQICSKCGRSIQTTI